MTSNRPRQPHFTTKIKFKFGFPKGLSITFSIFNYFFNSKNKKLRSRCVRPIPYFWTHRDRRETDGGWFCLFFHFTTTKMHEINRKHFWSEHFTAKLSILAKRGFTNFSSWIWISGRRVVGRVHLSKSQQPSFSVYLSENQLENNFRTLNLSVTASNNY